MSWSQRQRSMRVLFTFSVPEAGEMGHPGIPFSHPPPIVSSPGSVVGSTIPRILEIKKYISL